MSLTDPLHPSSTFPSVLPLRVSKMKHVLTFVIGIASTALALTAAVFSFHSNKSAYAIAGGIGGGVGLINAAYVLMSNYNYINNTMAVLTGGIAVVAGIISLQKA